MKLIGAQIFNYRSIEDSNEFGIDDLTCLVGKNESGKTAILHAFYGIKPFGSFAYEKIRDYPRRYLNRFDERHPAGSSIVIKTRWTLSAADIDIIIDKYGAQALKETEIIIGKYIGNDSELWSMSCDDKACLEHLIKKYELEEIEKNTLKTANNAEEAIGGLLTKRKKSYAKR